MTAGRADVAAMLLLTFFAKMFSDPVKLLALLLTSHQSALLTLLLLMSTLAAPKRC